MSQGSRTDLVALNTALLRFYGPDTQRISPIESLPR